MRHSQLLALLCQFELIGDEDFISLWSFSTCPFSSRYEVHLLHSLSTFCKLLEISLYLACNSYTMVCPPVRGDNPRDLARTGGKYMVYIFYTTLINVDLAQNEIFGA